MGAMVSARRWAATAVAVTVCGWMSTLTPATADGGVETFAQAASRPATAAQPAPAPAPPKPAAPAPRKVDCAKAKCVALTFDDGPMSSTAKLLDILAQQKVRATFFLVGRNVAARQDLVRRELAEGHELANHSYTHADLGRSSAAKVRSELTRTQQAIKKASGVTPVLMRPPYGSTDKSVASISRQLKLAQILWAVDPLDWNARDSKVVENRVVSQTRTGDIVLMHDIHASTVAAVPNIIKRLAAKGYVFVTVSELYGAPLTPGKKYTKR